ncbi:MAG: amidohydrolase [Nannocystaceae bacterium]|nr:amidohydrolase [Nannocystaceae bacterium]
MCAAIVLGGAVALALTACRKTPTVATTSPPAAREPNRDRAAAAPATPQAPSFALRGARVMTATGIVYDRADVLVTGDRIVAVGPALELPEGTTVIDVAGRTVTPGIIDTHSHIGVYGAPGFGAHADGNEMTSPNTAHVRAADAYWPQDPQIDRARAGGITTMQILPGSANLFGGRAVTVKTYPGARGIDEARMDGAPAGLKMACGENPKRTYGDKGGPATRMGNVAGYRGAFIKAVEYQRSWDRYHEKMAQRRKAAAAGGTPRKGDDDRKGDGKPDDPPDPPARDLGLETLAGVLRGEILVHNHCYRADEMLGMLALAKEFGFTIRSFHHAVEAYKIAPELAAAGTAASVWADWWGFKAESFDGVRENAAMLSAAGGRPIIHSDSGIGIQRLNQEASKAMWAGRRAGLDIPDDEALRWITTNPAWALGIEQTVGTLEPGKQADLVVWDGDPFSVYTKAQQVYIEGALVFDRSRAQPAVGTDFELGWDIADAVRGGGR